jgi:hypothetical protein
MPVPLIALLARVAVVVKLLAYIKRKLSELMPGEEGRR